MQTELDSRIRSWTIGILTLTLGFGAGRLSADSLYGVRSQELLDGAGVLTGAGQVGDGLGGALVVGDFNFDGRDDVATFDFESSPGSAAAGAVHVIYGSASGLSGATDQLWLEFDPDLPVLDRQISAHFGAVLAVGRFNGDPYDDLAIGAPYRDIEGVPDAGWVMVVYGSSSGLQTDGSPLPRRFQLGVAGIFGGPRTPDDNMGWALAAGDFDGSGIEDLAIGIPGKAVGALDGAGRVLVLYGLAGGLSATNQRLFDQDSFDGGGTMLGVAEAGDHFGSSLAAGDFDGDGIDDLAIGVPDEGEAPGFGQGFVHVIYGSSTVGLQLFSNDGFTQTGTDSGELSENWDQFGQVLAAGDLSGDGPAELVIGTPFEDIEAVVTLADAGTITVLYGQAGTGISTLLSESYIESDFAVSGAVQSFDYFGSALAIGNFVSTTVDHLDLAIGIPGDDVWNGFQSQGDAGSVIVTTQNSAFLGSVVDRRWAQSYGGSAGLLVPNQRYGSALGGGDFDGDGFGDLAVGAPGFDVVGADNVGALYTLYGAMFSDGFGSANTTAWSATAP